MQNFDGATVAPSVAGQSHVLAGFGLIALGALLILGVGFMGSEVIHNAAHDARHAFAFPCH